MKGNEFQQPKSQLHLVKTLFFYNLFPLVSGTVSTRTKSVWTVKEKKPFPLAGMKDTAEKDFSISFD